MQTGMVRGDAGAFSRRLEDLKDTGSTLLVIGEDSRSRTAGSAQLLGDPRAGRRPVFVLLGKGRSVIDERWPDDPVEEAQIIESEFYRSAARSTSSDSVATEGSLDSLSMLLDEIEAAVQAITDRTDRSLSTGDLRVCIDSATPVVDGFDRGTVVSFIADLGAVMRTHAGMAHAVLPFRPLPDRFEWLEGEFDAVVETRTADGTEQERWRIPDDDLLTEWFPVSAVGRG